ncbi:TPA: damage-inducible protein, partial [Staphylococcus aureus]|nr:damage-inducible protein [Staphylococcus aureus]
MNYGQFEIESTIIATLLKQPDVLEKIRVKDYMFTNEKFKTFFNYVMDSGKIDHQEIYLKATKDKEFLDADTITKLYNSDFIGYGFFERYQQELLESYQLNKANELVTEFKQQPTNQNFNNLIDELKDLKTITNKKEDGT